MSDNIIVTAADAIEAVEDRYDFDQISYEERTMREMERRYPTADTLLASIEANQKSIERYTEKAAEIAAVEAELQKAWNEASAAAKEAERKALKARGELERIKNQRERTEKEINTSKRAINRLENELSRVLSGQDPVFIRGQGLVRGNGAGSRTVSLEEAQRQLARGVDWASGRISYAEYKNG